MAYEMMDRTLALKIADAIGWEVEFNVPCYWTIMKKGDLSFRINVYMDCLYYTDRLYLSSHLTPKKVLNIYQGIDHTVKYLKEKYIPLLEECAKPKKISYEKVKIGSGWMLYSLKKKEYWNGPYQTESDAKADIFGYDTKLKLVPVFVNITEATQHKI